MAEPRANERHAGIAHAGAQNGTRRDRGIIQASGVSMVQFAQFFAQCRRSPFAGIEFLQFVAGPLAGRRDKRQNDGGIGDIRFLPDQARNQLRIDPDTARLAAVGDDRIG